MTEIRSTALNAHYDVSFRSLHLTQPIGTSTALWLVSANWGTLSEESIIRGILGTYLGIVPTILVGGAVAGLAVLWIVVREVLGLKEIPNLELT